MWRSFVFVMEGAFGALVSMSLAMLVATSAGRADDPAEAKDVRYGEHVRPILSDRCFECHGPDPSSRQAGLRFDTFEEATADRGGYAAIVPGDPEVSELWLRVDALHPGDAMPPPGAGKKPLTDEERDVLRRWIEAGAEYERHWSYVAPDRPAVPGVGEPGWCRTDIDRFVLARLDGRGLAPSADADDATLLRRLFLDVTGLPPAPAELDDFLSDDRPDAYERWVHRLLTEEPYRSRFAEHWASSWLDASRYGDTSGIHQDNGRQMWLWRDWVLEALRGNMPYDRFIVEQIAGDLVPDASVDQLIASGFNRNHVTTDEGGAIAEEYLVEYAVDRVNTTFGVFLGLTTGCARCHDHKYDPVTQEEFYQLTAFFNSIDEPGLYSQTPDANRAYEPFIEVPTEEQTASLGELSARIGSLEEEMSRPAPEDAAHRAAFIADSTAKSGVRWTLPDVVDARSSDERVSLELQPDGSLQASGPMPGQEDYVIRLATAATGQRLVLLEALPNEGTGPGAGRATHGNAVISRLLVEARPEGRDGPWQPIGMRWAWSDHTQTNRDFEATNLLGEGDTPGWAADGNENAGQRLLCLLAEDEFGFEDGTELRVTIAFRSNYPSHSLGRVRVRLGAIADTGIAMLPASLGRWYVAGHFKAATRDGAFDELHGPEAAGALTSGAEFAGAVRYRFDASLVDDSPVRLPGGVGSNYLGRVIVSPDARELDVSLGSDDGYRLFVNGVVVAKERVNRGVAPDQSRATIALEPGRNTLVLQIVNTGGPSGYYFSARRDDDVLSPDLVSALVPGELLGEAQAKRLEAVHRRLISPAYRQAEQALAEARAAEAEIRASVPRTMVMKELPARRETFVLMRGQYDHPDPERPVNADVPAVLGRLPADAPRNRLGLAHWMTAPQNPLVARVAVNRIWQTVFGTGIVRTAEDFGLQGEWPSHPELLDWLAVELVESGWDAQHILRLILTSSAYRQASVVREDGQEVDPENRLVWRYPRRRLSAEQIRDQALYASGLLTEHLGGPSVKPYQPLGLWREVAMPTSNTRNFQRDAGDALWRRTLYTYWKRASPPPALQTFDAPTREACVIRRPITNTPLQALVLWNDEQYVEASRVLAQRTLAESADDVERLSTMFRRCTGREPEIRELGRLQHALEIFRARYEDAPVDAEELLAVGESPRRNDIDPAELAAWTVVASSVLSLHETITQD